MPGVNQLVLVGEVCREPKLRYSQAGMAILNVNVLVETVARYGDEARERKDVLPVTAFKAVAEAAANIPVGAIVCVTGRASSRTYESKGEERVAVELVASSIEPIDRTNSVTPATPKREERREPEAAPQHDGPTTY